MELVLLIGIPATGKSTFCREHFYESHVRLNLDMLRTRHREQRLFETCLATGAKIVVDNTNVTAAERARYLGPAQSAGYRCVGYYFQSVLADAIARNAVRNERLPENRRIPAAGVGGATGRLELPRVEEGFDALHYVRIDPAGGFAVESWRPEMSG